MSEVAEPIRIGPQPGQQEKFLATSADIAIYGGAAGAGKTWAALLEPLRHVVTNTEFNCVIFRRNMPQVKNPGGLWDESMKLYPLTSAKPIATISEWQWPEGGKLKFAHLDHESTKLDWQGSQIPLIIFDELTHFSETQFFYLLSRNRSMCGVRPYIRATCNPDADSWVARLLAWWIDKDGFPIPERSGVIRWFIRINDALIWGDSREELIEKYGVPGLSADDDLQVKPKSFTFVPGKLSDNQALMKADPGYLANLKSLPLVEQARLLGGNWKIRAAAGLFFKREWVEIVDWVPANLDIVRAWDLAATEKVDTNDPDFTAGVKMGRDRVTGLTYVIHATQAQVSPLGVEQKIAAIAEGDGVGIRIRMPQDPAQAGKSQKSNFSRQVLPNYNVIFKTVKGDKVQRFGPFSAQCQAGNVKVLRGHWNEEYFSTLEAFPSEAHDDYADASSDAYSELVEGQTGLHDYYRKEAEARAAAEAAAAAEEAAKNTQANPAAGLMNFYKA
jgi:predicted phage terminase large subunit-like protein